MKLRCCRSNYFFAVLFAIGFGSFSGCSIGEKITSFCVDELFHKAFHPSESSNQRAARWDREEKERLEQEEKERRESEERKYQLPQHSSDRHFLHEKR